jgi:hypothetical protein
MSKITVTFKTNGALTDVTSVYLNNPDGSYGVKRNDTNAVIVVAGTAMTKLSTGVYEYEFTDPAYSLEYTYWIQWVYGGETHRKSRIVTGPEDIFSIESAEIITRIRQITSRNNTTDLPDTTIEGYIVDCARKIANKTMSLKSSTSGTLSADTNTIDEPLDMIPCQQAIDAFYLDSTLLNPISFDEWRQGYKRGYAYRNRTIYISPTSDNDKTYTLYYSKEHDSTITPLELGDEYKEAVIYLVCSMIFDDYSMQEQADTYRIKYENEMTSIPLTEPMTVIYRRE